MKIEIYLIICYYLLHNVGIFVPVNYAVSVFIVSNLELKLILSRYVTVM